MGTSIKGGIDQGEGRLGKKRETRPEGIRTSKYLKPKRRTKFKKNEIF